jgi:hypothetical protein
MKESVNNSELWHEESSDDECAENLDTHSLSKWAKCNAGPKCYHCQRYGHFAFACPRKFRNRVVEGLDEALVKPLLRGIKDHYVTQSAMASYLKAKPSVDQCIVLRYRMIKYHLGSIEELVSYIEKNYDSKSNPVLKTSAANPPARTAASEAQARPVIKSVKSSSQQDKPIASKADVKVDKRGEKKVTKVSQVCKAITDAKIEEKKRLEQEKNKIELEAQKEKLTKRRSWELFKETFTQKIPLVRYEVVKVEHTIKPRWTDKFKDMLHMKPKVGYHNERVEVPNGFRIIPPDMNAWYLNWEVDANAIIDNLRSRHHISVKISELPYEKLKIMAVRVANNQVGPDLQDLIEKFRAKEDNEEEESRRSYMYGYED